MDTFTLVHVLISLAAIVAGFPVVYGLLTARPFPRWTAFFLATTVATSATGFGFPFERLLPSHVFGVVSLVLLALALVARYGRQLRGRWRATYVVGVVLSFYLNCFVLVVQSFLKVPALHALAPTQTEVPFQLTQAVVLVLFVAAGVLALRRFHPAGCTPPA